jgi:superfamily II DNA/RNA helicase
VVAVGATISPGALKALQAALPSMAVVTAGLLHQPPPNIRHRFVKVRGPNAKPSELLVLVRGGRYTRMLIFCNNARTAKWLALYLQENVRLWGEGAAIFEDGVCFGEGRGAASPLRFLPFPVPALQSAAVPVSSQGHRCSAATGEMPRHTRRANMDDFASGATDILVATDVLMRGVDLPDVDHVVMFDFPASSTTYLHRAGRTGRAEKL